MAINYNPRIITDGLVLYLDAGNIKSYPGSGTTWIDLVSQKNNTINGAIYDEDNIGSISFDGVDDSSSIGSLGLTGFTGFTVNVWFYSNLSSHMSLVRSLSVGNAFILHYRGAGFYLTADDSTVSGYLGWQTFPTANQWNMLTGTWDGTTMKLYQNGIKQSNELSFNGGINGALADINTVQVGYYFNPSQPWTNGKIASLNLYNKALSIDEIKLNLEATRGRFGV